MPAPTVALVMRSIRMNEPVSRHCSYGSNAIGWSSDRLQMPISFSSSFFAARCSSVLTFTLYLGSVIVAVTCLVPSFSQYGRPGQHRLVGHPHDDRLELVGHAGQVVRPRDDVAAADVDLVGERERDRLAGDRMVEVAIHRDDARDGALATRGQHADAVALPHHAAGDRAGEAAEIEVRPVDPLHRQPQRTVLRQVFDLAPSRGNPSASARGTRACSRWVR